MGIIVYFLTQYNYCDKNGSDCIKMVWIKLMFLFISETEKTAREREGSWPYSFHDRK